MIGGGNGMAYYQLGYEYLYVSERRVCQHRCVCRWSEREAAGEKEVVFNRRFAMVMANDSDHWRWWSHWISNEKG